MVLVEDGHAAPQPKAGFPRARAGVAVHATADEMPQRVTAERIAGQQEDVEGHHYRADADTEVPRTGDQGSTAHAVHRPTCCEEDVVGEDENEDYGCVHEEPMDILQNEREPSLPLIAVPRLADAAGDRVEEKRAIVGHPVVVASRPESERENENQKRGRERPPRRPDIGGVKRREVRSPLVVRTGPGCPRRVNRETAEHEGGERGRDPPGIATQRRAEAALLEVPDGSRHSVTAAIVCLTASADFCNADCSSGVSLTSTICSSPRFPSLHGTPQYIPDNPSSPSSHAAQGRRRVRPSTIDATICTP